MLPPSEGTVKQQSRATLPSRKERRVAQPEAGLSADSQRFLGFIPKNTKNKPEVQQRPFLKIRTLKKPCDQSFHSPGPSTVTRRQVQCIISTKPSNGSMLSLRIREDA